MASGRPERHPRPEREEEVNRVAIWLLAALAVWAMAGVVIFSLVLF